MDRQRTYFPYKSKYGIVKLYCEYGFNKANNVFKKCICNQCGPGGWKIDVVPDSILGIHIGEACNIHDWMYEFSEKRTKYKNIADKVMLDNCIRLIRAKKKQWGWTRRLREKIAYGYYLGVKKGGGISFWENDDSIKEGGF